MKTAPPSSDRTVLAVAQHGLPEIPLIGRYIYTRAHPPLRPHIHRDAFEVCVLRSGTQTYRIGDRRLELAAGDMIVTRPGEVHGTGNEPESRGCLYWIQFEKPCRRRPFLGLPASASRALVEPLSRLESPLHHGCELLFGTFERILSHPLRPASSALTMLSLRNHVLRLLLDIVSLTAREAPHARSAGVRGALQHLARHYAEPVSLAGLAAAAGVSASYLKAHFKREVGMTPMEHLMWLRVERAKQELRDTRTPVTELAFRLGFATSQHFATVFKRLCGDTPSHYRASAALAPQRRERPIVGAGAAFHPVAAPQRGA